MPNYKSYWDHSEEERAGLCEIEVHELLRYELMEKGVLQPPPLVLESEKPPELKKEHYYRVNLKFHNWDSNDIPALFHNPVDARTFLQMEWVFEDYEHGENCARPRTEQSITSVELPTYDEVVMHQAALAESRKARERNAIAKREHEKLLEAATEASKAIWDDWRTCLSEADHLKRIREKFNEYFEMADDTEIAMKFLLKVPAFHTEETAKALPEYAELVYTLSGHTKESGVPEKVADDVTF